MHNRSFRISGVQAYCVGLSIVGGAGHGWLAISYLGFSHLLIRRIRLHLSVCGRSCSRQLALVWVFVTSGSSLASALVLMGYGTGVRNGCLFLSNS